MSKLFTSGVLMIIPGLVIALDLAFSISDKSCLYQFSVSINNQLLAIWLLHQLLVAPCLVFCDAKSCSTVLSTFLVISRCNHTHTHCTPTRRGPVCVCPAQRVIIGVWFGRWAARCRGDPSPDSNLPQCTLGKQEVWEGGKEWMMTGFMVINSSWDLKGEAARVVEQA